MSESGEGRGLIGSIEFEDELRRGLAESDACCMGHLHLTVSGGMLLLDGFVHSLDQKRRAERACEEITDEILVVNRLRVAQVPERHVS